MALFWAGDAAAAWSGLAAFGVLMNGAALLVGYCTWIVFTRRIAPLAGAGTLALILPPTIWATGAPLATAITGVAVCRLLGGLSLPPALASLPVLRQTSGRPRQVFRRHQRRVVPGHEPSEALTWPGISGEVSSSSEIIKANSNAAENPGCFSRNSLRTYAMFSALC
jgi:hypothetical protein